MKQTCKIGEIKIGDYPIILNDFMTTCQADNGIAKAANLENMLDDAVDKDSILEQIDEQMKVINDTYDDIVKDRVQQNTGHEWSPELKGQFSPVIPGT